MMKQATHNTTEENQKFTCIKKFAKRVTILGILIFGFCPSIYSQSQTQETHFEELIYIEVDPFAYINKGYSVHLGYENWGMRFDLTKVKVDFPISFEEAFYDTKAFDLVTNITGVKVDYIGTRKNWTKNAFVGLDLNYQKLSFEHRATQQSKDLNAFNIGLRAGYKLSIFKGFYITPWAAVWRNVASNQKYTVQDDHITTNDWDWIVTLHVGYAYRF